MLLGRVRRKFGLMIPVSDVALGRECQKFGLMIPVSDVALGRECQDRECYSAVYGGSISVLFG
jgi:hypothetical protein